MINNKRVLAIVPARGGSKGLPGKNKWMICGKPLIVWTIEIALKSKYIDYLLVSTDDEEICHIATQAGAEVPFQRPKNLSSDTATTVAVVEHAIEFLKQKKDLSFDYIVLLEPTSPLREYDDIDAMLDILINSPKYDSIMSLGEIGLEHPMSMKKTENGVVKDFIPNISYYSRRQDLPKAYFPYGVGYIITTEAFQENRAFETANTTYYLIKRYQNYEIDDIYDLITVENIMRYEWKIQ